MAASSQSGDSVSFTAEEVQALEWAELVLLGIAPGEVRQLSDMERWLLMDMAGVKARLQAGKPP